LRLSALVLLVLFGTAGSASASADLAAELTASTQKTVRTGRVVYTLTARNTSTTEGAVGVTAHIALEPGLDLDVARLDAGCTAGSTDSGDFVDCRLPDIGRGAEATAIVDAVALTVGTSRVDGTVASSADPNAANNAASVTTEATYDSVRRCPAANFFAGTDGADRITGTPFSDPIYSGKGDDTVFGLAGSDCISAGPGNDSVRAGPGNDRIDGGTGRDRISGGSGRDRIFAHAGNDTIDASDRAHDTVDCGFGHDTVFASRGDKLRSCERVRMKRPS
jgi:Ca2+-binding RTX toxin-like protein